MFRRALLTAAIVLMIPTTANATPAAHDQAMSYILADQDLPQEPGDLLHTDEKKENCPMLVDTTGYCRGTHGSHGDKMEKGYVAYTPESYGSALEVYEAVETEEGYKLGEFIGLYEIRDTGYGKSTGQGKSAVRADKKHEGTIEAGLSVDTYFPTYGECVSWMKKTGGKVFIVIIPNVKG